LSRYQRLRACAAIRRKPQDVGGRRDEGCPVIIKLLEGHIETCVTECVVTEEGADALAKLKGALAIVLKKCPSPLPR